MLRGIIMTKCANFVCLNEASGLKRMRGKFCKSCLASSQPYVFECTMCKVTFVPKGNHFSRIPLSCSNKCRNRRKYLRNGKEWSRKYAISKPRPKVKMIAKLCLACDEPFKCYKRGKYCSPKCRSSHDRKYNAMKRHFKYTKAVVAQRLNLSKPQESLYVPQR